MGKLHAVTATVRQSIVFQGQPPELQGDERKCFLLSALEFPHIPTMVTADTLSQGTEFPHPPSGNDGHFITGGRDPAPTDCGNGGHFITAGRVEAATVSMLRGVVLQYICDRPEFFLFKDFIYFREGEGGRKSGRGPSTCGCLSRVP